MEIRHIAGLVAMVIAVFLPITAWAQNSDALSLQSVISLAEQKNYQLLALHQETEAARARGWTTWWPTDPDLSVEWEGVPSGAGLSAYEERRLTFSQEFEFPLNMYWRNRLATQRVETAVMRYAQGRAATRKQAIITYTHYLAVLEKNALTTKRVQLAQDFLETAVIRRNAGEAPAVEVARAQVEVARAENELYSMESEQVAALATLNALLGHDPDHKITPLDSLVYRRYNVALDSLKQLADLAHPLLGETAARVRAANQQRKLAWGSLLPSVEFSAFRQNIGGNPDFYGMEIGLKIPLWFAFRQRGKIKEASAMLSAQTHRHSAVKLDLLAQIEHAYAAFIAAREQAETYEDKLLAPANDVYRITRRSYESGESNYLQLLESQQTLIEVDVGHIAVLANYYSAIAALEKAAGLTIIK